MGQEDFYPAFMGKIRQDNFCATYTNELKCREKIKAITL